MICKIVIPYVLLLLACVIHILSNSNHRFGVQWIQAQSSKQ